MIFSVRRLLVSVSNLSASPWLTTTHRLSQELIPIALLCPTATQLFYFSLKLLTRWRQVHSHLCWSVRKALFLVLIEHPDDSIPSETAGGQKLFNAPSRLCLPLSYRHQPSKEHIACHCCCHFPVFWSLSLPIRTLTLIQFLSPHPSFHLTPVTSLSSRTTAHLLSSWCLDSSSGCPFSSLPLLCSLAAPLEFVPLSRCRFQISCLLQSGYSLNKHPEGLCAGNFGLLSSEGGGPLRSGA